MGGAEPAPRGRAISRAHRLHALTGHGRGRHSRIYQMVFSAASQRGVPDRRPGTQLRKEAFLIDDRANGGGNISRMVIQRLTRTMLGLTYARTLATPSPYPDSVFIGPKAVLLDENSGSDGDIFPWMFRTAKLGPLIGERSWGGVVGITSHGQLIDGGDVNVPEFAYATAEGQWAVEGHGVDPDIVVENDPKSVIEGHDPQLERGVAELLKALEKSNPKLPEHAPYPVKLK